LVKGGGRRATTCSQSLITLPTTVRPPAAVKDDIESKVSALPDHRKLYRAGRVEGAREMVVRANYLVIYMESKTGITIPRVLHGAQQWPPERG
jgi:plasmid stabilization system protein ParE